MSRFSEGPVREKEETSVVGSTSAMNTAVFLGNQSSKTEKHSGSTTVTLTLGFIFTVCTWPIVVTPLISFPQLFKTLCFKYYNCWEQQTEIDSDPCNSVAGIQMSFSGKVSGFQTF